ncbi:hypothetical protein [Methylomarinum vadi]|uniref:hypothetical protein n=1 Tax=Methylomarinum vadi TaxID=438855 RepID=UPI000689458D|nr:hypothetical protein [Methylomarinum vadi]
MNKQYHRLPACLAAFPRTLIALLLLTAATSALAHRGPADEVDTCRIRVGPEVIHFTAYTPTFSQGTGYCQAIPFVGPTNLVFDYEGHKLRDVTVEFEITKEPEGTQIFHQGPKKIKTGTVNATVDFSQHGAGDYLVHVTIMHEGEKQDTHLPFSVGVEPESSNTGVLKIVIPIVFIAIMLFFMLRRSKDEPEASD